MQQLSYLGRKISVGYCTIDIRYGKKLDVGLHCHNDHGKTDQNAFDDAMKLGILDVENPAEIEKKKFIWRHRFNTFQPMGIKRSTSLELLTLEKLDVIRIS